MEMQGKRDPYLADYKVSFFLVFSIGVDSVCVTEKRLDSMRMVKFKHFPCSITIMEVLFMISQQLH